MTGAETDCAGRRRSSRTARSSGLSCSETTIFSGSAGTREAEAAAAYPRSSRCFSARCGEWSIFALPDTATGRSTPSRLRIGGAARLRRTTRRTTGRRLRRKNNRRQRRSRRGPFQVSTRGVSPERLAPGRLGSRTLRTATRRRGQRASAWAHHCRTGAVNPKGASIVTARADRAVELHRRDQARASRRVRRGPRRVPVISRSL